MKYLTVTNWFDKEIMPRMKYKTGFYQWLQVFDGDIEIYSRVEDFDDYDVVHVNMTGGDTNLIPAIKERTKNSSTKLIASTDYSIELWQGRYGHPFVLKNAANNADAVIATEYCLASALTSLLGRKVYKIPHPANIDYLSKVKKEPKNVAGVMYHRYDDQIYAPYIALSNTEYTPALLGYLHKESTHKNIVGSLFPNIVGYSEHEDILEVMSKCAFLYEPTTIHTYGRISVEAAAMGIPCVGSMLSEAQRSLFPKLSADPYDFIKLKKIINEKLANKEKVKTWLDKARENVKYYSHEVCRDSFKKVLEEVKK